MSPVRLAIAKCRLVLVIAMLIAFVCSSGFGSTVEYADDTDTWKRFIEQQVRREVAGKKPPVQDKITWKDYWTSWYDEIRISPGLPWPGSEFKTHEHMIRFIKQRLKAHRLPPYE